MRIGMLGPLEVVADGRNARIGGVRLRALLARLALAPGTVIALPALTEALWPGGGPEHPAPALYSLASRLRRALPDPSVLHSEPAGYRLAVPAEAVDATRFERLARDGRRALRAGQPGPAAEHLTAALELWRGDPLAEVVHLPYAAAAAGRLQELRLGVLEDRLEAALMTGDDVAERVAELQHLVAAHPLRERLRELQVTALDADGRRSEAIAAYGRYRELLAEELGTDPGPHLQELHLRLLRGRGHGPHRPGNLRASWTSFVGRDAELQRVHARLGENRLVTLVGPGGVGKTRLAGAVTAAGSTARACSVELGSVSDDVEVPPAAASALGLPVSDELVTRVAEDLATGPALLVLDGCEHVIDGAAELTEELLGRCPQLRVLVTSRQPLGIAGEALSPVPPLEPGPAAHLFADRARAVHPGFVTTSAVEQICDRLDGLPLAIELAAARLRSMPVETLAAGLDDRLRLLTGGSRTAPPRHRTLRAVVAWSWELLTSDERDAADRAAVFPASFTVEAAEHVGVPAEAVHALVDKSLLSAGDGRYRMLDTVREYGLERLDQDGRLAQARAAHAAYVLDLAERAEPHLRGHRQVPWIARLAAERAHLVAALRDAGDTGDADTAVRLGAALALFWAVHGEHGEATRRLRDALRVPGTAPEEARLRATAGYLLNAMFAGELAEAVAAVEPLPDRDDPVAAFVRALVAMTTGETAAGLSELEPHLAHDDPWTRAMLRLVRSFLHGVVGEVGDARRDAGAAATAFRESGERWGLSLSLMSAASALATTGATVDALAMLDEATELVHELGTHDRQWVWLAMVRIDAGDRDGARRQLSAALREGTSAREAALARICLADLDRQDGDLAEAGHHLDLVTLDLVTLDTEKADPADRALHAIARGHFAVATGDLDTAARHLAEGLDLATAMSDMPMLASAAVGLADLLVRRGEPHRAAAVLGAADALRGGPAPNDPDVARLTRALADPRDAYERARDGGLAGAVATVRAARPGPG